jgi:tRNA dimethylallyltransferase
MAISLAKKLQTVILSADSRQIFKELTIGTAKPSSEELDQVQHYFINTHSIKENYDAAQFGRDALQLIHQLFEKKDDLILCGGSGLYVKAVCEGFDDIPVIPPHIRQDLNKNYHSQGLLWLQEQVKELDPELLSKIDYQNPHRLIRALEVKIGTGKSIREFQNKKKIQHPFHIIKIGLELPKEELYGRINNRMDKMIADGLFEEAKSVESFKEHQALKTVGYQEIFGYFEGQYNYDEAVMLLKRNSRRYAKRQLTWFKRDQEIRWFNSNAVDFDAFI